jgi:hypothetical protein
MHESERVVLLLSVVANLAIVGGVIAVAILAPDWLKDHERLHDIAKKVQAAVLILVLAFPFVPLLRLAKVALIRENSVRLGPDEVPALYAILERQSEALGISPVPELYVSASVGSEPSSATSLLGGPQVILLKPDLFNGLEEIEERIDAYSFIIGHELGRLRLGHASWWEELFLGYLKRIPVLRLPLLTVQTLARDRVAALLAPDGIRGLVMLACGGDLLRHVDVDAYLREALAGPPAWSGLAAWARTGPHISVRVRELYEGGFFKRPDLAQPEVPAPVQH